MAGQFRFRLPWLTAPVAPRPSAGPQPPLRTPTLTSVPAQPTPSAPAPQTPFRPAGTAPVQPPPPPRTESQLESPPRTTIETQEDPTLSSAATNQTPSPSRTINQARAPPVPPSPSRASRATSAPPSPSRATRAPSVPPSPSRTRRAPSVPPSPSLSTTEPNDTLQPEPPSHSTTQTERLAAQQQSTTPATPSASLATSQPQAVPEPRSPSSLASQHAIQTEESSQRPVVSDQQHLTTFGREEPKPPQIAEAKSEILSEKEKNMDFTLGPGSTTTEISMSPQKSNTNINIAAGQTLPPAKSEEEVKETIEGKKIVQEVPEEKKINGPSHEESMTAKITEISTTASGSAARGQALLRANFEARKQQQEKEAFYRKKTTTIGSNSDQFKTVGWSHPEGRNSLTDSHQKPSKSKGEPVPLHKEVREDISKLVHKLGKGHPNQDRQEKQVSVITVAGENKGAIMHVGSKPGKKDGKLHIHRGYNLNQEEEAEASSDGEGRSNGTRCNEPTTEDMGNMAYVNNNIQSINNSIMFDSSVSERDPGVHLVSIKEPTKSSAKDVPLEARKAEINVTPSEKLTHEPTVRRRCLRGLFLESSDSDLDNPSKPRPHGCRYGCGQQRISQT